jgi:hydroxyethylthiazole kinase-like sugar kinase family protein
MSAATGNVYSYTTGAANSAAIDFGFYYDTATANKFSVYALSAPQVQLGYYDLSSWTKNVTIMKKATSPAFANITSGGALRSAGIANLTSGTTNKITALAVGNLVFFKTATGKVGCMEIRFGNGSGPEKESFINVDVKIEK